ncbi:MAG TPA: methyltransferase domain-containing protein, partial [Anaerolineales bacterium]|nr:methyltransferase domain-containing protein [Anaerolineales bacterium]
VRVGWRLALGGAPIERDEYLARIDASPGNRILETAVGTGTNLLALPPGPDTFGLDISHAMLRRCRHRLNRDGRRAALVLADMASAPFADSVFDVVFHMGGLQFASDPLRCIAEMHRMARPGGQVLIVEETASAEVLARRSGVAGLEGLVPEESADVRIDTISGGELVAIEFLVKFRGAESRMPPP